MWGQAGVSVQLQGWGQTGVSEQRQDSGQTAAWTQAFQMRAVADGHDSPVKQKSK